MMPQRLAVASLVVAAMIGLGVRAGDAPIVVPPSFASLGSPTMPFVPSGSFITSTWFCPGAPAGGEGLGGSLEITNPGDSPIGGRITAYSSSVDSTEVVRPITVDARSSATVELADLQPSGSFISAVVEIDGGGGFVEQIARHPAGASVASCANAASSNWYFAEGFTVDDSTQQLVLTNPYPDAALVDISFVTAEQPRRPSRLKGYPIPGRSVQVIELGARDEPVLATQIIASRGRVVAGRIQHYSGGDRNGFSMTLGAPALSSQYYFADGEIGEGITERYSIYNPTDQEVIVFAVFLGLALDINFLNDTEIVVPAGRVVTLSTADVANFPAGRHGAVFSTFAGDSIVVERAITRPAGDGGIATTVVMGSPANLASNRWSAAVGSEIAIENALVVLNVDSVESTVTVSTLGPGGLVPIPGLESLALPAGGVITVPFTDPAVLGKPFVVDSPQRIVVERLLPRHPDLRGRSGSFPLAG